MTDQSLTFLINPFITPGKTEKVDFTIGVNTVEKIGGLLEDLSMMLLKAGLTWTSNIFAMPSTSNANYIFKFWKTKEVPLKLNTSLLYYVVHLFITLLKYVYNQIICHFNFLARLIFRHVRKNIVSFHYTCKLTNPQKHALERKCHRFLSFCC